MDIYDDVDDMWSFIVSVLHECLDTFAPLHSTVCKRSRRPTPWLTPSLLSAIKQKKQAKHRAERCNDDAAVQLYKHLKNKLKHLVNEAKMSYVKRLIFQTRKNPRSAGQLWCGVNNIIGRYQLRKSVLDTALSLDTVNDFFRSIAVTDDHKPASTFVPLELGYNDSSFRFSTVSSSSVYSMLCALDEKKAVGPDGLSARFLKEIANEITVPLTKLFNKSLETGIFPNDWKHCNVTPVHKSGSKDSPGNFRPISVVPVAAKMLEKIVAQQLSLYLESHQALSPYQCAYRRGKSTEQLLLVAVDAIASALDKNLCACVAFLDLRKAFDSLDHCLLLQRLGMLGVVGTEISWFVSYLSDRFQRVKYNNSYSNWGLVKGGIPQGSALGPLLFLVYMNNLSSQVTCGSLLQYADDTALICAGSTLSVVHQQLCDDLSRLLSWVNQSKMQLNIEKSSIMWFRPRSLLTVSPPDVVVDSTPLRPVSTQKYLGVIFDDRLDWSAHVAAVCKKVSFYLFWINSHRKNLPSEVIKMLIDSLVLSRLSYALPVWGPMLSKSQLNRLQNLHNWGVRITACLQKYDHVSYHRHQLNWLSVSSMIRYRSLCVMHGIYHHNNVPFDPPIIFGSTHAYRTRWSERLIQPVYCRLSATKTLFRHLVSRWWNELSDDLVTSPTFLSSAYDYFLTTDA